VIEDDVPTQQALKVLLENEALEVRTVRDGNDALAAVKNFDPHLVLMDWRVPGLAGAQLCRRIRRRRHPPPIIIVSSADEAFSTEADVVARLRKPVDPRRLTAAVAAQILHANDR
jgi:DNA-binding response OmpR family regulator